MAENSEQLNVHLHLYEVRDDAAETLDFRYVLQFSLADNDFTNRAHQVRVYQGLFSVYADFQNAGIHEDFLPVENDIINKGARSFQLQLNPEQITKLKFKPLFDR